MDARVASKANEDADGPWPLPPGWCWARVGDLPFGGDGSLEPFKTPNARFVLYSIPAYETGVPELVKGNQVESTKQLVPPNALLVSKINPRINRIWRVKDHSPVDGLIIASTEWIVVREAHAVEPDFLRLFLTTERVRQFLAANVSGVGGSLMRVNAATVGAISFPLAPLAEQRRIVERVDALFAEIADGEAALAKAREGLEAFRRAVLKAAVTGELTADWRAANPVEETGHDLLARIVRNRAAKAPAKGRGRRAANAAPLDTSALQDLPEGWAWGTLGEVGEIVGGATVDKKRKPSDPVTVPYLRVANVQRGHVDLSEVKSITVERASADKLRLEVGDLLLNEGGDRDKIGRGWVWDGAVPEMIHQNHVFRVRLRERGLSPVFVSHYANEMGRRFFIDEGKQTTNLASISLSKISLLPIPIPPPAEAAEILRRVSEALAAATDMLAMMDAEAADAARLKQSILKAAFEGRLVAQDPTDEPASALLARAAARPATARARRGRARTSE